jgi:NAD(P)-dependent dehydrogenase (short-subunit alcohol dehydrogenase family)
MTVRFDYTGQVAMITGASAGMGLAAARAFARAGASTALVDVNESAVRAVADELAGDGHQVLALVGDVSDETQVASVVADVVSAYGRIDAAFNNAGIMMPPLKTADTDNAIFDRVVAVNLAGVWNCLKHEIIRMRMQHNDRQQLLDRRPQKRSRSVCLYRDQARRRRPHQVGGAGRRGPRHTRQRGVPGHNHHPHGRADDRSRRPRR